MEAWEDWHRGGTVSHVQGLSTGVGERKRAWLDHYSFTSHTLAILETPLNTCRYCPATHCSALVGCSEGWQVTVELLSSWSVRYSETHKDWLHQPHLSGISLQIAAAPSEVLCDDFLQYPDLEGTPRMRSGQLCTGPGPIQCRWVVLPQRAGGGAGAEVS